MTHTDPIKALVEHMERHIEQYYGTEHTPIFNWTEWEAILAALKPMADAVPMKTPTGWVGEVALSVNKDGKYCDWSEPRFSFWKPNVPDGAIRNLYPVYAMLAAAPPASPAPVDGERVRAAKIEAFDEALSIAEGSYSYGEQQNEIIAGIRAALAAINGEE